MTTIDQLLEEYGQALSAAARLDVEADVAEEARKTAYAKAVLVRVKMDLSVMKAEYEARADQDYQAANFKQKAAAKEAGEAKAKVVYLAARLDVWRTRESTRRELLKQGDR